MPYMPYYSYMLYIYIFIYIYGICMYVCVHTLGAHLALLLALHLLLLLLLALASSQLLAPSIDHRQIPLNGVVCLAQILYLFAQYRDALLGTQIGICKGITVLYKFSVRLPSADSSLLNLPNSTRKFNGQGRTPDALDVLCCCCCCCCCS